jgi:hypothetical protein
VWRAIAAGLLVALAGAVGALAFTVQAGNLRMSAFAQIKPYKLPRHKPAPIAVFVAGHIESTQADLPPQVQSMRIEVNRHGLLRSRGLPVCPLAKIVAASAARALASCKGALLGSGRFWAHIVLPDQGAYPTRGQLLVFNGRLHGRPVLLVHVFTSNPFNTAFTIPFSIRAIDRGPYGTELAAAFPSALGAWGYLDRIKLTLRREYRFKGRKLSFFNSACPAPAGTKFTAYPLARATLYLQGAALSTEITKSCGVKE